MKFPTSRNSVLLDWEGSTVLDHSSDTHTAKAPCPGPVGEKDIVHRYLGSGTLDDPYIVGWDEADSEDPYNWSTTRKWIITTQVCNLF